MGEGEDIKYMERALELASMAGGNTRPNPLVGSVIVHGGKIIGEGYHTRAGEPHAEVNAINSVADRSLLSASVMYVTLEPCSHYGKTGPCAELISSLGIPELKIGTVDTSGKVSGRGIEILKKSGCKVATGLLENECREMNRRFFTYHEKGRPYIILKWAESADGFIDGRTNPAEMSGVRWITGDQERTMVHKWRSEEHAVMVGANTARIDDPSLNVREWTGTDPLRVVLSGSGNLPAGLKIFTDGGKTIVYGKEGIHDRSGIEYVGLAERDDLLPRIMNDLASRNIQSVMVEGGAILLDRFIVSGLWDEARVFTSGRNLGSGLRAPKITDAAVKAETVLMGSTLRTYRNKG